MQDRDRLYGAKLLLCHISYKYYATLLLILFTVEHKVFIESVLQKAYLAT